MPASLCTKRHAAALRLQEYSAYQCVPGQPSPSGPTPPGGYFGNPQFLVLESRDPDSETRNFSPVTLDTQGVQVGRLTG